MTKNIEKILRKMYNISSGDDIYSGIVPYNVIDALNDVNVLCQRAGGELLSRQIIANIILTNDIDRCWDTKYK